MEIVFSIIVLAIVIWIDWYIAKQFEEVAENKGHMDRKYFWICFFLGVMGYLLVIALPDRSKKLQSVRDELPDL